MAQWRGRRLGASSVAVGGVKPEEQWDCVGRGWLDDGGASSTAGGSVWPEEQSNRGGRGWPSGGGATSITSDRQMASGARGAVGPRRLWSDT
jgi:hypothetical protein